MADELGSLAVSIGLDSTGFATGITGINKQLKLLDSSFKANTAALGENAKGIDGLRLKAENLSKQEELQREKVDALQEAYNKSVETKGRDARATQDLEIRLNHANAALSRTQTAIAETTRELAIQGSAWNNLSERMAGTTANLQAVGKKFTSIGKSLAIGITMPLLGVATAAAKVGMDFESAMSNVSAISGATGEDFNKLSDKAKEMGAKTSKSATESANALSFMALAGWDTTQMIDGLEPILRLSEAGNMDLARASDIVTDSMSSLGLEVKDLPEYLDKMAMASTKSNTSVDQLGEAFVIAGGTFKNLNVSLGESNAILGILANRGMKGSEAGNSLNSIMINLTTGAGQAGKAMADLNIEAFDSSGKFKGMGNVLKEVGNKTKDMTEEQKNMYLAMIGGKTQLTTLQALVDGVGKEFDSLQGNIDASTGSLAKMAETMQDNTKGDITKLKSALEGIGITLSDILLPKIRAFAEKLQELTSRFAAMSPAQQEMIIKFALIAGAIGPLLFIVGKLILAASFITGAIATVSGAMAVITVGATAATPAIAGLAAVFTFLISPIGIAIAVIAGLAALAFVVYKNWEPISAFFMKLWTDVSTIFSATWTGIKTALVGVWNELRSTATTAWNALKSTATTIGSSIVNGVINIWNGLLAWFRGLPGQLSNIGSNMFTSMRNGISGTISGVKNTIVNGIMSAMSWITSMPSKMYSYGVDMIQGMINGIKAMVGRIGSAVSGVANKIRSYLHFSVPDEGPLTDYESWMPDFMGGLATGIEKNKFKVAQAIQGLSTDMTMGVKYKALPSTSQDMAMKTAQEVTRGVMASMQTQNQPSESSQPIQVNLHMDGAVISRQLFRLQQGRMHSLGVSG